MIVRPFLLLCGALAQELGEFTTARIFAPCVEARRAHE